MAERVRFQDTAAIADASNHNNLGLKESILQEVSKILIDLKLDIKYDNENHENTFNGKLKLLQETNTENLKLFDRSVSEKLKNFKSRLLSLETKLNEDQGLKSQLADCSVTISSASVRDSISSDKRIVSISNENGEEVEVEAEAEEVYYEFEHRLTSLEEQFASLQNLYNVVVKDNVKLDENMKSFKVELLKQSNTQAETKVMKLNDNLSNQIYSQILDLSASVDLLDDRLGSLENNYNDFAFTNSQGIQESHSELNNKVEGLKKMIINSQQLFNERETLKTKEVKDFMIEKQHALLQKIDLLSAMIDEFKDVNEQDKEQLENCQKDLEAKYKSLNNEVIGYKNTKEEELIKLVDSKFEAESERWTKLYEMKQRISANTNQNTNQIANFNEVQQDSTDNVSRSSSVASTNTQYYDTIDNFYGAKQKNTDFSRGLKLINEPIAATATSPSTKTERESVHTTPQAIHIERVDVFSEPRDDSSSRSHAYHENSNSGSSDSKNKSGANTINYHPLPKLGRPVNITRSGNFHGSPFLASTISLVKSNEGILNASDYHLDQLHISQLVNTSLLVFKNSIMEDIEARNSKFLQKLELIVNRADAFSRLSNSDGSSGDNALSNNYVGSERSYLSWLQTFKRSGASQSMPSYSDDNHGNVNTQNEGSETNISAGQSNNDYIEVDANKKSLASHPIKLQDFSHNDSDTNVSTDATANASHYEIFTNTATPISHGGAIYRKDRDSKHDDDDLEEHYNDSVQKSRNSEGQRGSTLSCPEASTASSSDSEDDFITERAEGATHNLGSSKGDGALEASEPNDRNSNLTNGLLEEFQIKSIITEGIEHVKIGNKQSKSVSETIADNDNVHINERVLIAAVASSDSLKEVEINENVPLRQPCLTKNSQQNTLNSNIRSTSAPNSQLPFMDHSAVMDIVTALMQKQTVRFENDLSQKMSKLNQELNKMSDTLIKQEKCLAGIKEWQERVNGKNFKKHAREFSLGSVDCYIGENEEPFNFSGPQSNRNSQSGSNLKFFTNAYDLKSGEEAGAGHGADAQQCNDELDADSRVHSDFACPQNEKSEKNAAVYTERDNSRDGNSNVEDVTRFNKSVLTRARDANLAGELSSSSSSSSSVTVYNHTGRSTSNHRHILLSRVSGTLKVTKDIKRNMSTGDLGKSSEFTAEPSSNYYDPGTGIESRPTIEEIGPGLVDKEETHGFEGGSQMPISEQVQEPPALEESTGDVLEQMTPIVDPVLQRRLSERSARGQAQIRKSARNLFEDLQTNIKPEFASPQQTQEPTYAQNPASYARESLFEPPSETPFARYHTTSSGQGPEPRPRDESLPPHAITNNRIAALKEEISFLVSRIANIEKRQAESEIEWKTSLAHQNRNGRKLAENYISEKLKLKEEVIIDLINNNNRHLIDKLIQAHTESLNDKVIAKNKEINELSHKVTYLEELLTQRNYFSAGGLNTESGAVDVSDRKGKEKETPETNVWTQNVEARDTNVRPVDDDEAQLQFVKHRETFLGSADKPKENVAREGSNKTEQLAEEYLNKAQKRRGLTFSDNELTKYIEELERKPSRRPSQKYVAENILTPKPVIAPEKQERPQFSPPGVKKYSTITLDQLRLAKKNNLDSSQMESNLPLSSGIMSSNELGKDKSPLNTADIGKGKKTFGKRGSRAFSLLGGTIKSTLQKRQR